MGLGDILRGAANIITGGMGGLGGKIVETIAARFPEKMSEAEKAEATLLAETVAAQRATEMMGQWNDQERQWQDFVKDMEGTASDLKSLPVVGKVVLFLRGLQRPLWGYGTLYMDFKILSGDWSIREITSSNPEIAPQIVSLIWVINIVVLVFLFGERAVKNIAPLIEKLLKAKD